MGDIECPGRLALCGVPCGCEGNNQSHYPALASDTGEQATTGQDDDDE